jgi:hypothetical protein
MESSLGYPGAPVAGPVLYLATDRPTQVARAARRIFTDHHRDLLAERVKVCKGPLPADVAKNPTVNR